MAEESSQQFTSAGNMSASSATVGKFSSVPPVRQASIRKSSVSQSSQIKYVYAGIGEQPLTQREFDENLKNLRNILSEVDGLLHGDMRNPENIKHCQQLLGFATSLRLPQEVKDKEIRSYPPVMQQLYQSVKNEGASVSTASQMAQARHATTAMAQIMASDAHTVADLKAAIANGWDINAKHLNPDGSYSTYVDYQGKVLSETAAFDERLISRLDEIMAMPDGPEKERALKEHQAAADANHQRAMMAVDNLGAALQTGELNPEEEGKALEILEETEERARKDAQRYRGLAARATTPEARERFENLAQRRENLANDANDHINNQVHYNACLGDLMNNGDNSSQENRVSSDIGSAREFSNDGEKPQSAVANNQRAMTDMGNVGVAFQTGKLNSEDGDKALEILEETEEHARKEAQRYRDLAAQATTPEACEHFENLAQQRDTLVSQAQGILSTTDVREVQRVVADAPSSMQNSTDASRNLNGMGRVASIGFRAPINNTMPSNLEALSITDAMASLGNGNASGDLDFGIVPGERIGTMPRSSVGRVNGFRRGGIARTNQSLDLGIGLVSTTVAPKVPENAAESSAITTERATADNPIVTADNQSSDQRMVDLTATLGAKKENPLGKPVNLEETSDINLLNARSQQSQAMA
ncbi:MAG: hypothetical protein IKZ02_03315 [Alphaproteobacteria bacterium]|nr:hypothetical protein [Alphaproteobacteria bacterium]